MNSFRSLVLPLRLHDCYGLWPAALAALCKWRFMTLTAGLGQRLAKNNYGSLERKVSMKSVGSNPRTPCSIGKTAPTWKTNAAGSFPSRQSSSSPDSNRC